MGPYHPITRELYADGAPAVQRQEDGSGVVAYPSGRKAVCIISSHRSRRMGAVFYAARDFVQPSAVPADLRAGGGAAVALAEDGLDESGRPLPRTRHLGAFDEWGLGAVRTTPDGRTGGSGLYEVTKGSVQVQHPDGRRIVVPRSNPTVLAQNAKELSLRVNSEIVLSFDIDAETTLVNFSSEGVQYAFHIGEIWKGGSATALKSTTPAAIFDSIDLRGQSSLDATAGAALGKAQTLQQTLKISSGTATERSLQQTLLPSALEQALAPPGTPPPGAARSKSMPSLDRTRTLCDGRVHYIFEHKLRKHLATKVAPPLSRTLIKPTLRDGFTYPKPPVGSPPTWPLRPTPPGTLEQLSSRQVQDLVAEMESQGVLVVVLLTAMWATGSVYSSAEHARSVCEAAYGEIIARGDGDKVRFVASEVSEAGAIHSDTRWSNELVKQYGVRSVPWMLMFANGKNILSENPAPEGKPDGAGLGCTHRLRYMAFAKPRVLVLEPSTPEFPGSAALLPPMSGFPAGGGGGTVGGSGGGGQSNAFKLQLETQNALKRAGFSYDLAVTVTDARHMASDASPPYGMLLVGSSVGEALVSELATRIRQRCPKALSFVCHDGKNVGPLSESLRVLVDRKDLIAGVFQRPISKSRLEHALLPHEAVRINYPECGQSKDTLVQLIEKRLTEV